jgi:hypothetical protein
MPTNAQQTYKAAEDSISNPYLSNRTKLGRLGVALGLQHTVIQG